jgi:alpha-L-fucosidase
MALKTSFTVMLVAGSLLVVTIPTSAAPPAETLGQSDARLKWFKDARFGMFIHWGGVCRPGRSLAGQGDSWNR